MEEAPLEKKKTPGISACWTGMQDELELLDMRIGLAMPGFGLKTITVIAYLFAWTVAALALHWERSYGWAGFELFLLLCVVFVYCSPSVKQSLRPIQKALLPYTRDPPRWAKATFATLVLGAHLAVISVLRTNTWQSWVPVLGLAMLAGGCVLGSTHRSAISVGTVSTGFALQFWFGVLVTRTDAGSWALSYVSCLMTTLLKYAGLGAAFVFGDDLLAFFAFSVLPIILYFSAIISLLAYLGALQVVFKYGGAALANFLAVSEVEGIVTVANVFLSMTEAPLLLTPLLPGLSRSQLFVVMTGGFASVAGSTLGAYISFGADPSQLLSASIMSAPAALAVAKMLVPETGSAKDAADEAAADAARAEAAQLARRQRVHARLAAKRQGRPTGSPPRDSYTFSGLRYTVPNAAAAAVADTAIAPPMAQSRDRKQAADEQGEAPTASEQGEASGVREVSRGGEGVTGGIELPPSTDANAVDALSAGALTGVGICASVLAVLVVFVSVVALLNDLFRWWFAMIGVEGVTFELFLGYVFTPLAYMMGVDASECLTVGKLIGVKIVQNEFVGYFQLGELIAAGGLSERAQTIATYALCGFGNLGSMGIMVGCLSGMVPRIRTAVTRDVFRALLAGNIACFSTACVASAILADAGSEAPSQYECPCFKSECPAP